MFESIKRDPTKSYFRLARAWISSFLLIHTVVSFLAYSLLSFGVNHANVYFIDLYRILLPFLISWKLSIVLATFATALYASLTRIKIRERLKASHVLGACALALLLVFYTISHFEWAKSNLSQQKKLILDLAQSYAIKSKPGTSIFQSSKPTGRPLLEDQQFMQHQFVEQLIADTRNEELNSYLSSLIQTSPLGIEIGTLDRALYTAIANLNVAAVKSLLKYGANPGPLSRGGEYALYMARSLGAGMDKRNLCGLVQFDNIISLNIAPMLPCRPIHHWNSPEKWEIVAALKAARATEFAGKGGITQHKKVLKIEVVSISIDTPDPKENQPIALNIELRNASDQALDFESSALAQPPEYIIGEVTLAIQDAKEKFESAGSYLVPSKDRTLGALDKFTTKIELVYNLPAGSYRVFGIFNSLTPVRSRPKISSVFARLTVAPSN